MDYFYDLRSKYLALYYIGTTNTLDKAIQYENSFEKIWFLADTESKWRWFQKAVQKENSNGIISCWVKLVNWHFIALASLLFLKAAD